MSKKIGVSKTQPKGEARPLGTPKSKSQSKSQVKSQIVPSSPFASLGREKSLDTPAPPVVESSSQSVTQSVNEPTTSGAKTMVEITLTKNTEQRRSSSVVYEGAGLKHSVKFSKTAFANGGAPDTLVLGFNEGILAEPSKPKASMTPEERKAARANAPKLTLAEKIAKREASLQALKDKAAKASQPSL